MSSTKSDFDALMVDWLYDELDPAEAERFEEYLATHPEANAEAESLKHTRAAFRDLEGAEPTHSLSAILMREAALATAPAESWWSRFAAFFQPIFLHPAASAAATVVLLCGVAGALYLRDGAPKLAEPQAGSQAAAPVDVATLEAARDPGDPPPALSGALEGYEQAYDEAQAEDADSFSVDLANAEQEEAVVGATATPEPLRKRAKPKADSKQARSENKDGDLRAGARDRLDQGVERSAPALNSKSTKKAESKPAPEKTASTKALAWEESQNQDLKVAAQSKRCQEVGRIANDILDKNSSFYKEEVEKSKAAQDCRYYIASETQRRAKTRQKNATARAKAKQGEAVPPKVPAAPRESDSESVEGL